MATELVLTGQRSELGRAVIRQAETIVGGGRGRTLVNLAAQGANTLLHDGHRWKADPAADIIAGTRRALAEARRRRAGFVVHTSFAFLGDAQQGGAVGRRLRPIVDAALEAEAMVLDGERAACVLRLGYHYGPDSRDLRAYRRAFALGRPYWAGPRRNLQHHIHTDDAARAVLVAALRRPAGELLYATDGTPASFADFMDHFARAVGRGRPLHLPQFSGPLVGLVVRGHHREMTDLAATSPPMPRLRGFTPTYPDYRAGLAQVIEAWTAET